MNNNLISIKLNIAGKSYPIKVVVEEEVVARKIEKELNQKINDFQLQYKDVEKEESLVMLLLTYAFDMHKVKSTRDKQVDSKMNLIEELIEAKLSS